MRSRRILRYTLVTLLFLFGLGFLYASQATAGYRPLAEEVTEGEQSPDGQYVVFSRPISTANGGLFSVFINTGVETKLDGDTERYTLQITPDSRWVLYLEYTSPDQSTARLMRVPIQGGVPVVMAEGENLQPANSLNEWVMPNSEHILFVQNVDEPDGVPGLFSVPLAGGPVVELDGVDDYVGVNGGIVSPDGQWVAYSAASTSTPPDYPIYVVPIAGGESVNVNTTGYNVYNDFRFSADSNRLVFRVNIQAGSFPIPHLDRLYSVDRQGENLVALSGDMIGNSSFDLTPNGNQVVFSQYATTDTDDREIFVVSLTGDVPLLLHQDVTTSTTSVRAVTNDYALLQVSDSSEPGNPKTYVESVPLDGSEPSTRLTPHLGIDVMQFSICAELTPDGNTLVYAPLCYESPVILFSIPIDGSTPAVQLHPTSVGRWIMNNDSSSVFFTTVEDDRAVVREAALDGTTSQLLYKAASATEVVRLQFEIVQNNRVVLGVSDEATGEARLIVADTALSPVQFAGTGNLTEEISGTYTTTVTLDAASLTTVTAQIEVVGGTATEGEDYTFTPLTVTFAPGEMAVPVPLTLLEDETEEPTETIILEISNIEGGVAGTPITQTITIAETVYRQWMPITTHLR
jgi:Tol biopolymer transport system component